MSFLYISFFIVGYLDDKSGLSEAGREDLRVENSVFLLLEETQHSGRETRTRISDPLPCTSLQKINSLWSRMSARDESVPKITEFWLEELLRCRFYL